MSNFKLQSIQYRAMEEAKATIMKQLLSNEARDRCKSVFVNYNYMN